MTTVKALIGTAIAALLLAGCGASDGTDDEAAAKDRVIAFYKAFGDGDAQKACSILTTAAKESLLGTCEDRITEAYSGLGEADRKSFDAVAVKSATVTGDTAKITLTVETARGTKNERVHRMLKLRGEWYLDELNGAAGSGGSSSGTSMLSGTSLESLITTELGNRGYPNAQITCADVVNVVGTKFTCTVEGVPDFSTVKGSVAPNDQINLDSVS